MDFSKVLGVGMRKIERITSGDGLKFVEVFQHGDQSYVLRRFAKKFDPEEDVHYEIEILPHPASRFVDLQAAIDEAQRMVEVE
jgi:hypothetical protein